MVVYSQFSNFVNIFFIIPYASNAFLAASRFDADLAVLATSYAAFIFALIASEICFVSTSAALLVHQFVSGSIIEGSVEFHVFSGSHVVHVSSVQVNSPHDNTSLFHCVHETISQLAIAHVSVVVHVSCHARGSITDIIHTPAPTRRSKPTILIAIKTIFLVLDASGEIAG